MSLTVSPPSQVAHKSKSLCVSGPSGASASTAKHILKFIIIFNYANVCMQEFVHICVCAHTQVSKEFGDVGYPQTWSHKRL